MNIVGLCGSLRPGSSNEQLLRACAALAPDLRLSITSDVGELPHFSPERDVDPLPGAVVRLRSALAACDGIIVSSPEYAHGIPGSLKNALDWLVSTTIINDKPLLLISASPSGGEFVHAHLTEVLKTMGVPPLVESLRVQGRPVFDDAGLPVDVELRERLLRGARALVAHIERASKPAPEGSRG